jgi:hypothetical protein
VKSAKKPVIYVVLEHFSEALETAKSPQKPHFQVSVTPGIIGWTISQPADGDEANDDHFAKEVFREVMPDETRPGTRGQAGNSRSRVLL